jgi:flavodoxin
MEELFNIIGKLYVDIYNTQKIIDILQSQLKEKDKEISELKHRKSNKDDIE